MNWLEIGEIKASKIKESVLKLLSTGYYTPKEISTRLKIHLSTASRSLTSLEKKGYVICVNPELRKGKLFTLTTKGENILKKISSLNEE